MAHVDHHVTLGKLVLLAQTGDTRAFELLIEETQRKLYRFCNILTSEKSQADDLFQETYIRAFTKIRKLRDPSQFSAWLFRIAKNVYLDDRRSEKSKAQGHEAIKNQMVEEAAFEPASTIAVRRALSQFDPQDKYLLALVDLAEFTYSEAAEILGETESAVKSRAFRLRKRFAKILSGD